ncbi:MAG: tRNA (adenosine(37)-N6)-dimethylallyltransferase MiaA [Gaiellaceae bacterium]|jgi:tRNA dimethylallyltransferase
MNRPSVLAIFGPTASGKSVVAEVVAERLDGELVSADAMQVYRDLPILTNQSPARLVGIWPLDHEASVGSYAPLAHEAIDEILGSGRTAIVVGGTGLYLRAALAEIELPPAPDPGARERWQRTFDELGPERAHALLAERDPLAAERVHANDRRRVVRALELNEAGHSLVRPDSRLWSGAMRHPTLVFGLELDSELLDARIERRTREMFERGVVEEVHAALEKRLSLTARRVMGLREIAELAPEQAIEGIAVRTRRYAAYQRKWMRRIPGLVSVNANRSPEEVADEIVEVARTGKRLPASRAV